MRPRRNTPPFGLIFRRLLLLGLFGYGIYWAATQGLEYWIGRDQFQSGTTIGEFDVSGMGRDEAVAALEIAYTKPVLVRYGNEVIEINPADAGFILDAGGTVDAALSEQNDIPHWQRYTAFAMQQNSLVPEVSVPIKASHSPEEVRVLVDLLADLLDQPATPPQLLTDDGSLQDGKPGYLLDRADAAEKISTALYSGTDRMVELKVDPQDAPEFNLSYLETYLRQQMEGFNGVGVIYVLDLQTGEEISINGDVAVSGLSIVKIAIMLESLRAIEGPITFDLIKLFEETAIYSGNFSANLLLDVVAGEDNAYLGVDVLTDSMQTLGLENTFIVTPYEEPPRGARPTLITSANSRTDINLDPDPAMQTTAEEMGQLLSMIYYCAQGKGTLLAVYPDQLTPEECQTLIDWMARNDEGNLIRFGAPEEVPVAHKHGWAYNTHGDAGIVFSPGGDFVIVEYLYQDSDWLPANISFPLLRELARSVYNFYNADDPYVDHKRAIRTAGRFAAEEAAKAYDTANGQ